MRVFNRYISPRGLTVFAFELVLIAGSVLYAMHLHGGVDTPGAIGKVLFITALCQLSFYYHDLYDLTVVNSRRELLVRLLQASGAASLLLAALYVIFPRLIIGHGVLASSVLFFVVADRGLAAALPAGGPCARAAGARAHRRHQCGRAHGGCARCSTSTTTPTRSSASSMTTPRC